MLRKEKKRKSRNNVYSTATASVFQVLYTSSTLRCSPPSISCNVPLSLFIFSYSFLEACFKSHLFYKGIPLNSGLSSFFRFLAMFIVYTWWYNHLTSYFLVFCISTSSLCFWFSLYYILFLNNIKLVVISPVSYALIHFIFTYLCSSHFLFL